GGRCRRRSRTAGRAGGGGMISRIPLAALGFLLLIAPAEAQRAKPAPQPAAPATTQAIAASDEPDLAFGAFQRGLYLTAFREATKRVEDKGDIKAMTLLAELYADGLGVASDDKKA